MNLFGTLPAPNPQNLNPKREPLQAKPEALSPEAFLATHICMYIYIYISFADTHTHHICTHIYIYMHMYIYIHTYKITYTHSYMCSHVRMYSSTFLSLSRLLTVYQVKGSPGCGSAMPGVPEYRDMGFRGLGFKGLRV